MPPWHSTGPPIWPVGEAWDGTDTIRTPSNTVFDALIAYARDRWHVEPAKVFDNLDPNVQDRLKSYDAQAGEVLNKFERLLLAVTKRQLAEIRVLIKGLT